MSTVPDTEQGCPGTSEIAPKTDQVCDECEQTCEKKGKKSRNVCFPDDGELVTQYFEPANPWQHVPSTTRAQLAAEYLESCRRHNTPPIDAVLQQIRELPENSIGGGNRAPRLSLAECCLSGSAAVDSLEALLRKVQFRRIEVDHAVIDDEGAEALFDMIEYYESASVVCISGPRQFGIRGWQAASRMVKKSAELSELEITESGLEASHAPVLARALRPHTCRLRSLCLQRAELCGEPLLCLVIALKSNTSVRELRLGDNRLTVADAAQLASLLRMNTSIHLLDLSNNEIQDAGAGHLAEALVQQAAQTPPSVATSPISPHHCPLTGGQEPRGLAFLVLWNNQLTRNCAQHLSKALRSSPSLCVLNVGRNALGGETVRALQGAGGLISLGLQAARLGPEAARAIADLIRHDSTLQRLDLRDNRLGSSGLQAILNAMKENTTLTQIDLDDPTESPARAPLEDSESAAVARLTRDIRALCRRNEPDATSPERRVHRKISLTCHTTCLVRTPLCMEDERRTSRLRSPLPSPAPSPAGSPVPLQHSQSRFSVTRVTPDRESSTDRSSPSTPTRPTYCPTPSRFKVVQVAEPPQIQVHPASSEPRKSLSRFSVTRNYDKMYNPSPSPSPVPSSGSDTAAEDMCDEDSDKDGRSDDSAPKGHSKSDSDEKCVKVVHSDNARTNSSSINVKNLGDKQTANERFSVSAVSESVTQGSHSADDIKPKAPRHGEKRFSVSVVDNIQANPIPVRANGSKRFSVSNVKETECNKTQSRFTTNLVTDNAKHISQSQSDVESVSDNERTKPITSESSVNIKPLGSEICKRFSVSNVPESVSNESSSDKDIKSNIIRNPDVTHHSITIPISSKTRLKSCMKNSENSRQGTSRSSEDVSCLRRENSETSEALSSHPNLKVISDLFKSLEMYGNTADNTVSLTSLTESKRPSVRGLFDEQQPETSKETDVCVQKVGGVEKNVIEKSEEDNITSLMANVIADKATQVSESTPELCSSEVTKLNEVSTCTDDGFLQTRTVETCSDGNSQQNVKNSVLNVSDEESQTHRSVCVSTDDNVHFAQITGDLIGKQNDGIESKEFKMANNKRSHQIGVVMDVCSQAEDFDTAIVLIESNRDSNLLKDKIPPTAAFKDDENKILGQTITERKQPNRSEGDDILENVYERNRLHTIDEVIIKTPKEDNVVATSVAKNIPEHAHIGITLHELSPGSTPHPSKGMRTFIMPEYHIDDTVQAGDADGTEHISKCIEGIEQVNKDDNAVYSCNQAERNPDIEKVIQNDLIIDTHANETVIYISIDDEFPVFDPKPIETNVPSTVHYIHTADGVIINDKSKVPDLAHSDSLLLETNVQPKSYGSDISHTKGLTYKDVLDISKNSDMPTFLPDTKVFSNETERFGNFDIESLHTEAERQTDKHIGFVADLTPIIQDVKKITDIQEDVTLPGAVQPILVSEIPIYSLSQLGNIPGTSRTLYEPTDVTTGLSAYDSDISQQTLKLIHTDTTDSKYLPGSFPDTYSTRLTLAEKDLSNITEIPRQIEITPKKTELSIKESKFRTTNLPTNIVAVPENVSVLGTINFSSIINPDINFDLEIQALLDEFRDMTKITLSESFKEENVAEIITDAESRQTTKSMSKHTWTNVNLNEKQVDEDMINIESDILNSPAMVNVARKDGVHRDTSKRVCKYDANSGQINETVIGNKNISDKTYLIYTNIGDISETFDKNDSVMREDAKKLDSVCTQKNSVYEKKDVKSGEKADMDSNKHDKYTDVSEVLTHNETKNAGVVRSETQLIKNTTEITEEEKINVELKMTVKKENIETKTSKNQKVVKKDALKKIELITKDLGDLIDEMKIVTVDRDKKDGARPKSVEIVKELQTINEPEKRIDIQRAEKDMKSEQLFQGEGKDKGVIVKDNALIGRNDIGTVTATERLRSESDSEHEVIREIKETEQNIKYLRSDDTDECSVKEILIESNRGTQRHIMETERHRKDVDTFKKEPKDKPVKVRESILKKNKSESSLDSSDMEVSRLMNKHINPFCDSSSSLEISGSSIESLTEPKLIITKHCVDSDVELDRRKEHTLSTGSSVESADVTPMNTNLLNMSVSSNESVSPIFGKTKNIRDSLSSLEASVSSIESNRQDRVMVTSADSGIEHSLPKDVQESSSNEGTLTNPMNIKHDTLTASPKRASSLLDVPALKSKGLDRMRKISWVTPSSSFNVAKQDDKEVKPSHLEKLLSLFQHPGSIFSRSTEEEKKTSTPPKKDSLLTSSFWSWGSGERDKDDSSEATDSTLSERVQVSYVDESFSKKLDSKTPSTDTENTLSEFQTFTQSERECENVDAYKVTLNTTDKSVVQIDLSLKCTEVNNGNRKVSNSLDIVSPNDLNKNYDTNDANKNSDNSPEMTEEVKREEKPEVVRPRSFAAVLKASGSENSLEKQNSPEGQPVDKLPSKIIRGIKENISPENTLTSSMSNTKALALELSERQLKNQPVVNTVWELTNPLLDKGEEKDLAPIATIEETCDESADIIQLDYIDDDKAGRKEVDVAKDALSYLIYENPDFEVTKEKNETPGQSSLADELKEAEIKEMFDLSPELIIDEAIEVFTAKDKGTRTSPIIPERAKLKKSNSLEDLKVEEQKNPKTKTIVFKVPESKPRDIPERSKLRTRSGSSPKSLPESLNKPCPLTKIDITKKKKKVSSLGKMANDSLLALNMSEEELAEFRRSYTLTSVESLRSLESVSEDANSQSGNSVDSRCRACLRTSQESLMSLDSITEDICRCTDSDKPGKSNR